MIAKTFAAAPTLLVCERLLPVLEALQGLEPLFHAAHADASIAHFEALVAPDFWEIGASGRRYSRAFALHVLATRQGVPDAAAWRTRDYHVFEVAPDNFMLTYTLEQPGRVTQRATLWRRTPGGWQAVFHQGTVVADGS